MKFKKLLPVLLTCISLACSAVCYAEPAETNPTETEQELNMTESEIPTEPTAAPVTEETVTEPLITTPSYYDEILKYVGEENAPQLNENLNNNALTIDQSAIDYSLKSMYTITTRSGDVFYLIINSSDGSVYFLNSVDNSDLTALLSADSQKAGNAINQSALENMKQTEAPTDLSGTVQTTTLKNSKQSDTKKNIISTLVMIVIAGVISFGIFWIKNRRNKRNAFDDDFLDSNEEIFKASEVVPYNDESDIESEPEIHQPLSDEAFENDTTQTIQQHSDTIQEDYYEDSNDFEETEDI